MPVGQQDDNARDVVAQVLAHLGLDPSTIPATTLAAVREALEGPEELDPRVLAARVPRYGNPRPVRSTVGAAPDLDTLDPRELAAYVTKDRIR